MKYYVFVNQYGTVLYEGDHFNEMDAWIAFWDACKYPQDERSIVDATEAGIVCKTCSKESTS